MLRTFSEVVRWDACCLFKHGTWASGGETWLAWLERGYRSTQTERRSWWRNRNTRGRPEARPLRHSLCVSRASSVRSGPSQTRGPRDLRLGMVLDKGSEERKWGRKPEGYTQRSRRCGDF